MPMEDVIRWLRGEHDDIQVVAGPLRERVFRTPPAQREQWIAELAQRFDDFVAYLRQRIAKEEEGGYLKPVLEIRPSMAEAAALLQREHVELTRIMDDLQRAVHRLPPNARLLLRDRCKRIEDLFRWIERHEEHETYLLMCAFGEGQREPR